MARLPVEFFDPPPSSSSSTFLPKVIRIGLKVPHSDEEQVYRQVGRALERLLGTS